MRTMPLNIERIDTLGTYHDKTLIKGFREIDRSYLLSVLYLVQLSVTGELKRTAKKRPTHHLQ